MVDRYCKICNTLFEVAFRSTKTKTCGSECKNILASQITKKQFDTVGSREKHAEITRIAMQDVDMKKIVSRRRSYKGNGHPLFGKPCSEIRKKRIGDANRGRFKGMTWEEMYGIETASRMKEHNARCMAETNARLLSDRTSKIERQSAKLVGEFGFEPNIQIGKYTVDLVHEPSRQIIEIYGDYWHGNPKFYKAADEIKVIHMTVAEKWEYDQKRVKYLEERNYICSIIWEDDLKTSDITVLAQDAIQAAVDDVKKKRAEFLKNKI